MQTYLVNGLFFAGILLLLALTVAVIQGIIILIDIRRTTKEVTDKVRAVASLLEIMNVFGKKFGDRFSPGSASIVAFAAGLKKAIQIFLKK